jgi:hypothetical protein
VRRTVRRTVGAGAWRKPHRRALERRWWRIVKGCGGGHMVRRPVKPADEVERPILGLVEHGFPEQRQHLGSSEGSSEEEQ